MTTDVQTILASARRNFERGDTAVPLQIAEEALANPETRIIGLCIGAAVSFRQGGHANAIYLLDQVADHVDCPGGVYEALGVLNCLVGRLTEALFYGKLATTKADDLGIIALFGRNFPKFADAFMNIGDRPQLKTAKFLTAINQDEEAAKAVEQHLQLFNNDVEALDLYAALLVKTARPQEAIGILRTILTLAGYSAELSSRLGKCLLATGDFSGATASHDLALLQNTSSPALWAAALQTWSYHPVVGSARHAALINGWKDSISAQASTEPLPVVHTTPNPKLRVGYLCSGLTDADTKAMLVKIAKAQRRNNISTFGFGAGFAFEQGNLVYGDCFERWVNVGHMSETKVSDALRKEKIDVLVDCNGFLAPKFNALFLNSSVPVKLSWLNLPEGVALPGATAHLADVLPCGPLLLPSVALPPGGFKNEKTADQGIVFAADAELAEITPDVAMAWAKILLDVPNSVLVLRQNKDMEVPSNVSRLVDLFGNFGVAHCIDVIGAPSAAEFFAEADIALAPFPMARPFPYGTALSLGIPVIVRNQGASKMLAAAVTAAGMGKEMCAESVEGYVDHAVRWAERGKLALFREAAPAKVLGSVSFAPEAFAVALEEVCRRLLEQRVS